MATAEEIATALRWHEEVFVARRFDAVDALVAPDFEYHNPTLAEPIRGAEGAKRFARALVDSYPDLDLPHVDAAAEGDTVVTRWRLTGTAQKPFGGLPGSGQAVDITGIDWFEMEDGKIRRLYQEFNTFRWMAQLGVIPG